MTLSYTLAYEGTFIYAYLESLGLAFITLVIQIPKEGLKVAYLEPEGRGSDRTCGGFSGLVICIAEGSTGKETHGCTHRVACCFPWFETCYSRVTGAIFCRCIAKVFQGTIHLVCSATPGQSGATGS